MMTLDGIRWLLNGPGADKKFHIGIKATGKDNLLGFIAGTTVKTVINTETIKMAEVNHLTVHAKLRNKKLTPILIKELQRRFNLAGVW
jgi:glycylpeptide N-tetradecanoyltransferase|tara:strand:+ start:607 stop:870 length:264 start_codon:yes stop_codon:yes gene_type:complete